MAGRPWAVVTEVGSTPMLPTGTASQKLHQSSLVGQFVSIQLRLSRNGKIAQQLVEALEARFPGSEFGGAASYEREVIYIHVRNHVAEAKRRDIEAWLREQKIEQNIAPQVLLRFDQDTGDNDISIK